MLLKKTISKKYYLREFSDLNSIKLLLNLLFKQGFIDEKIFKLLTLGGRGGGIAR